MKAFISYSHADEKYLTLLQKHLAQLRRDGSIADWTDNAIDAGGELDSEINKALADSELFIALVSADYIISNYCYHREFEEALRRHKEGTVKIVPIIVEDCDWQNTPFGGLKALPKDGKAIALWSSENTAMAGVVHSLRKLINNTNDEIGEIGLVPKPSALKYKVKKDFDSIQKIEFVDKAFNDVREKIQKNAEEILSLENIKAHIKENNKNEISCMLVNRNKTRDNDSTLNVTNSITKKENNYQSFGSSDHWIKFTVIQSGHQKSDHSFNLSNDDFHMYWVQQSFNYGHNENKFSSDQMIEQAWQTLLESVGIV